MFLMSFVLLVSIEAMNSKPISVKDLHKEFPGVNMEHRRARLATLGSHKFGKPRNGPFGDSPGDGKPLPTIHSDPDLPSILQVNQRNGIADYLFQGDMHLTEKQLAKMEESEDSNLARSRRQVYLYADKWTNGTVYYYLDDSLSAIMVRMIELSIQYLEDNTCIRFINDRNAENRIKFFYGTGCYSRFGMEGGEQPLSMGPGCNSVATAYHEILHALGYAHTQSRYDRDQYVQINLNKVWPNRTGNFEKFGKDEMEIFTPFEYGSAMEYPAISFTTDDSISITPRNMRYLWTMGSDVTTYYDVVMVNKYYCEDACQEDEVADCKNGGVPNPNDCMKCICPDGYGGTCCDERPAGCGTELTATSRWQKFTVKIGALGLWTSEWSFCHYLIWAPIGRKPQTRITFMPDGPRLTCFLGCPAHNIQFKTEDQKMTNILYCCKNDTATYETRTSQLNPMPVIASNRRDDFPVTFEYRYV